MSTYEIKFTAYTTVWSADDETHAKDVLFDLLETNELDIAIGSIEEVNKIS